MIQEITDITIETSDGEVIKFETGKMVYFYDVKIKKNLYYYQSVNFTFKKPNNQIKKIKVIKYKCNGEFNQILFNPEITMNKSNSYHSISYINLDSLNLSKQDKINLLKEKINNIDKALIMKLNSYFKKNFLENLQIFKKELKKLS